MAMAIMVQTMAIMITMTMLMKMTLKLDDGDGGGSGGWGRGYEVKLYKCHNTVLHTFDTFMILFYYLTLPSVPSMHTHDGSVVTFLPSSL